MRLFLKHLGNVAPAANAAASPPAPVLVEADTQAAELERAVRLICEEEMLDAGAPG